MQSEPAAVSARGGSRAGAERLWLEWGDQMKVTKPHRVTRSFTQTLAGPPEEVFPLLCPVRECDWVNGWNPDLVVSESGYAELDCVFVTPGTPEDAVWVVTRHDPEHWHLELLKLIPGVVVGKIVIRLERIAEGTSADISYTYTALSPHGEAAIDGFTQDHFDRFMKTWEEELNHFLLTGEKLARSG